MSCTVFVLFVFFLNLPTVNSGRPPHRSDTSLEACSLLHQDRLPYSQADDVRLTLALFLNSYPSEVLGNLQGPLYLKVF